MIELNGWFSTSSHHETLSKVITSWSSRRPAQVRPAHRAPKKGCIEGKDNERHEGKLSIWWSWISFRMLLVKLLGSVQFPGFSTDRRCPLWALCTTAARGRLFCGVPTSPEGWGGVAAGSNYPVLLLSEEKHIETWDMEFHQSWVGKGVTQKLQSACHQNHVQAGCGLIRIQRWSITPPLCFGVGLSEHKVYPKFAILMRIHFQTNPFCSRI